MVRPLRRSQYGLQFEQGVAADDRHGREAQPTTRRRLKHPGRDFQRSSIARFFETAPTHGLSTLDQNLVHGDRTTEPRMPRITNFSRLSIVGVALSSCITVIARTRGWAGGRRN